MTRVYLGDAHVLADRIENVPAERALTLAGEAREHLTTAATMSREMAMGFWLEKAETRLRE